MEVIRQLVPRLRRTRWLTVGNDIVPLRRGVKFGLIAELGELRDKAVSFDLDGAAVEAVGPQVVMEGAVLEHVVDRGQHRGGDGADGLLRAVFAAQPVELRLLVAFLRLAAGFTRHQTAARVEAVALTRLVSC